MKKSEFLTYVHLCAMPLLILALGCIMLIHPDSASVLITNLIGWVLVIVSGVLGAKGLRSRAQSRSAGLFCALGALLCGIWLLNHPLALASALGRFLGAMLLYRGGRDLLYWHRRKQSGSPAGFPLLAAITALAGLVLFFLPLSASRMLFKITGLVLAALGICELYGRLRKKALPEDPNIIDAL